MSENSINSKNFAKKYQKFFGSSEIITIDSYPAICEEDAQWTLELSANSLRTVTMESVRKEFSESSNVHWVK